MAESLRSQFEIMFWVFERLWVQPIFYRADRGVNSESARSQFTDAYLLTGQMADSPMGQARKEFKAARARLGSTHSYLCIVSVRGSAVWPLGSRVGRLCHLAKRAAIWQWQIFTCPKWCAKAAAQLFLKIAKPRAGLDHMRDVSWPPIARWARRW